MRYIIVCYILICHTQLLCAQENFNEYKQKLTSQFNAYKKEKIDEIEKYRKRLNTKYAYYMRQTWTKHTANPAIPVPQRKEPPKPVVKIPNTQTRTVFEPLTVLPFNDMVIPVRPTQPVTPAIPLPKMEYVKDSISGHIFSYYGTLCKIAGMNSNHLFALTGIKESNVAEAWDILSDGKYLAVLAQCNEYREKLNLCDWGYVRFLQEMTTSFFSSSQRNEAVLMQIYLLVQSGFRVRMARTGDRLVLLLPIEYEVYNYAYLTVDDISYYIIDSKDISQSFYVYDRAFERESALSLYMSSPPSLQTTDEKNMKRTLISNNQISVTVETDKNLIDFYNDYPISSQWGYYSNTSLSQETKSVLYPTLQEYIEGKSSAEAANLLLNFVQTAFEYKTDQEQFGYERPLFGDETLYYPYCDCEDRSILFSILARDLLGIKVVLLNYPGHLATAIKLKEEIEGDYILLDDGKYIICDPTYIGASIGEAMPEYYNEKASIIRI